MFAKEKTVASATGGGLSWLIQDVLVTNESVLAAALIGAILGTWLTSEQMWARFGGKGDGRRAQRGLWVLKIGASLGMVLMLVVAGTAWTIRFLPNVPFGNGLVMGVPEPALAGIVALLALIVLPRLWEPALRAAQRFFETWRK
jgi:hypothetical protein